VLTSFLEGIRFKPSLRKVVRLWFPVDDDYDDFLDRSNEIS